VVERAGSATEFSPEWLKGQLSQLLPQFPNAAVCVAFSGGADSTALLAALAAAPARPARLRAIYVDHQLQCGLAGLGAALPQGSAVARRAAASPACACGTRARAVAGSGGTGGALWALW